MRYPRLRVLPSKETFVSMLASKVGLDELDLLSSME